MNDTQKTVFALISSALFRQSIDMPDNIDWKAVFGEIKKQETVSLLYPAISNMDIPDDILNNWKKQRDLYLINNANNINSHFAIHRLMEKSNIVVTSELIRSSISPFVYFCKDIQSAFKIL